MSGTVLCNAIEEARQRCGIKVLYVLDPAQLPPVGERASPSLHITDKPENRAILRKVMRYDNELLVLATAIRECIKNKNWHSPLRSSHSDGKGVWLMPESRFCGNLVRSIAENPAGVKAIAWRNKTVDRYNKMVREHLGFRDAYNVGDRILLAGPIEKGGTMIAHTDDEFRVDEVASSKVTVLENGAKVPCWILSVSNDEQSLILQVPVDDFVVSSILSRLAQAARRAKRADQRAAWETFWSVKNQFNKIRYGYALTAHRGQGSTYTMAFVDQMDILSNSTKREAFRCLYVACTRATDRIISF